MENKIISDWFYQYSDDIYHYLIYKLGSTDVEDLVQDVFIRAIKGFDSFKGNASPKTWLISIARHVAIDEVRKRKSAKFKTMQISNSKNYENSPEMILSQMETNKELFLAIQLLKPNYRDVIILRAIKELSVGETADILNWSENKVRITFHRALKALKKVRGLL